MKYFIFLFLAFFTYSCSQKSVYVAMPTMPEMFEKSKPKALAVPIKVEEFTFARTNDYSDYFAQSNVLLRLNEELSALLSSMREQLLNLLVKKGYKVDDNASLTLSTNISLFLKESALQKDGNEIKSLLMLNLDAKSKLQDNLKIKEITSKAGFDNPLPISYTAPSTDYVPTLFNKDLYPSLFASDNLLLSFYKGFLVTMQNSLPSTNSPKAKEVNSKTPKLTDEEAGDVTANTGSSLPDDEESEKDKEPIKVKPLKQDKNFPNQEVIIF